jgi:hypothetical protein
MARTSARSAAKESSPPKQVVPPRTRVTRSQSVELGNVASPQRTTKRTTRAGSTESMTSQSSVGSSRIGRSKKIGKAPAQRGNSPIKGHILLDLTATIELSIVQEDSSESEDEDIEILSIAREDNEQEVEEADEDQGEEEEELAQVEFENDEPDKVDDAEQSPFTGFEDDHLRSPGAMSGTTANTVNQSRALDPVMAGNFLPDLYEQSTKILDLFVPENVTKARVLSCMNKVKVSGTSLSKLLQVREQAFNVTREIYSTDLYLNSEAVNLSVFGTKKPAQFDFRPDAIIQKANLAILIKDFIPSVEGSESWYRQLAVLHSNWPKPFLSSFGEAEVGSSWVRQETFEIGLEIRTMCTIATLHALKDLEGLAGRDEDAAGCFYYPPEVRDPSKSYLDDIIANGQIREMFSWGNDEKFPNLKKEDKMIKERFQIIRTCFRESKEATEDGDTVDFEELHAQFPWVPFLTHLVRWSRFRLNEINETISSQGGVQKITQHIAQLGGDSQPDSMPEDTSAMMEQPGPLLPAAPITDGNTGQRYDIDQLQ